MDKILDILDSIAHEKALTLTQVEEALIEALVRTAKKMGDYTLEYGASIDKENKKLNLFQKIEVLSNDDERLTAETVKGERFDKETRRKVEADVPNNTDNFISLDNAKELDEDLEIGDFVQYDMEFEHMGRNAATILHSNFEYKLQNFVSDNLFEKYQSQIGNIITSNVTSIDPQDNTFVEIGEVRGIMPRKNRIKGEKFKVKVKMGNEYSHPDDFDHYISYVQLFNGETLLGQATFTAGALGNQKENLEDEWEVPIFSPKCFFKKEH